MLKILLIFIIICIVLLILILLRSKYEMRQFVLTEYTIRDKLLPKTFSGKKIVFLSDLHGRTYGEHNEKLIEEVDKIHPDLVLIGGDMMVVKGWKKMDFSACFDLLNGISGKYPIIYADGNHETRMQENEEIYSGWYPAFCDMLANKEVCYLQNDTAALFIDENGKMNINSSNEDLSCETVLISGLSLQMEYYKKAYFIRRLYLPKDYVNKQLPKLTDPRFHILLAHTPLYVEQYVNAGGNLILSGHFHGGCVRLPRIGSLVSPQLQLFPRFAFGYKKCKNAHVVVSAGLGTHSVNIRVNNPPELLVLHLEKEQE